MLLLSGSGTIIKFHNCETWNQKFTFLNTTELLYDLKWSCNGEHVVQVKENKGADILSVTDKSFKSIQNVPIKNPCAAAFYRNNARNLAIGTTDGKTHIWDIESKNILKTYQYESSTRVRFLDFNANDTVLCVTLNNNDVILHSNTINEHIDTIKIPNTISALKFHRQNNSIIGIITCSGEIKLRDINASKDIMYLETENYFMDMCFSPVKENCVLLCSYDNKKIETYDIRSLKVVNTILTKYNPYCIDMNVKGYIAIGTDSGEILIYDNRNHIKPISVLKDHNNYITCIAFQPFVSKKKVGSESSISASNKSSNDETNYQKLDKKINALQEKLDKRINALQEKLDQELNALREKLEKKNSLSVKLDEKINTFQEKRDRGIVLLSGKLDKKKENPNFLLEENKKLRSEIEMLRKNLFLQNS